MVMGNKWRHQGNEYKICRKWASNSSHLQQWQMTWLLLERTLQAGECSRRIPSALARKREQTHVRGEVPSVIVPNSFPFGPLKIEAQVFVFSHPIWKMPESLNWPGGRCQFEPRGDLITASQQYEIDELSGRWHLLTKCQGGIAEIYLVPCWLQWCWELKRQQGKSERLQWFLVIGEWRCVCVVGGGSHLKWCVAKWSLLSKHRGIPRTAFLLKSKFHFWDVWFENMKMKSFHTVKNTAKLVFFDSGK